VKLAVQEGAEVVAGGKRLDRPGFFYPPTVVIRASHGMPLMEEETYGPVAPVVAVDSFEEGLEQANRTEYGLSATVCTENPVRAMAAIEQLDVGLVRINALRGPVVGIGTDPVKQSGIGVGRGLDFMRELIVAKGVHWRSHLR
jgi:acyl-CoA reductase-like NAD-dependent aldehyde dehydrogenase